MHPSRMFNQGTMQTRELMREVSAMRLAEQAARSTEPPAWRFSPVGSLAFRIASWRRLSTGRLFREQENVAVSSRRAHGV